MQIWPRGFLRAYNQNVTQIFLDQPDFLREGGRGDVHVGGALGLKVCFYGAWKGP